MDWSNERYVRLYTRETTTHRLLGFEGQALLPQLLKLVDRSGVLELGGAEPSEAVAAALPKWPTDFVARGLADLEQRRVVSINATAIVMPKFLEAQEARQSDAQRQRDSRERRRDAELDEVVSHGVTRCHTVSHAVTPPVPIRTILKEDLGGTPPEVVARDILAEEFEKQIRPAYPKRDGDQRWVQALSSYRVARRSGESFEAMRDGLARYVLWCHQRGTVGTSNVKQAASFFGREKCWREPWAIVEQKKNGNVRKLRLVSGREIVVQPGKRIEWTDNPQACDAYELPNGTLSVKSGASWVNA